MSESNGGTPPTITAIIPAEGWWIHHYRKDAVLKTRVAAWALIQDAEGTSVRPLIADDLWLELADSRRYDMPTLAHESEDLCTCDPPRCRVCDGIDLDQ